MDIVAREKLYVTCTLFYVAVFGVCDCIAPEVRSMSMSSRWRRTPSTFCFRTTATMVSFTPNQPQSVFYEYISPYYLFIYLFIQQSTLQHTEDYHYSCNIPLLYILSINILGHRSHVRLLAGTLPGRNSGQVVQSINQSVKTHLYSAMS